MNNTQFFLDLLRFGFTKQHRKLLRVVITTDIIVSMYFNSRYSAYRSGALFLRVFTVGQLTVLCFKGRGSVPAGLKIHDHARVGAGVVDQLLLYELPAHMRR